MTSSLPEVSSAGVRTRPTRRSTRAVPVASPRVEQLQAGGVLVVRGDVVVRTVGADDVVQAVTLLDRAEQTAGGPLVDETERARLHDLAHGCPERRWFPLVACHGPSIAGYTGVTVTAADDLSAELAVDRANAGAEAARSALLEGLRALVGRNQAQELTVWVRHARDDDVVDATAHGFVVARRLIVLGRSLTQPIGPVALPACHRLRRYRPDRDDEAVVEVLAAAFAGTPDAGWDRDRLAERRSYGWFDADDLLLAEDPAGQVGGVHWTKRRGGGVGEVYVLATRPDVQGSGLGRALLRAGLHHLQDGGCGQVILWVDEANHRAVSLYHTEMFEPLWTDLAFVAEAS